MERRLFPPQLITLLAMIVMVGALVVMPAVPALAADPPIATVELVPDYSQPPVVDGTFDVTVRGTSNIYTAGYQVFLKYDPAYVQPQSVVLGANFPDTDPLLDPMDWVDDNINGVMGVFGVVPLNATAPVVDWASPGAVDYCTITFKALQQTGSSCSDETLITFITDGAQNTLFPGDATRPGEVTSITGTGDISAALPFFDPVDIAPDAPGAVGVSVFVQDAGLGSVTPLNWTPLAYDTDGTSGIQKDELVTAMLDYFFAKALNKCQLVDIMLAYFFPTV